MAEEKANADNPADPNPAPKWWETYRSLNGWHQIIYAVYAIPMFVLNLAAAMLLYIPWRMFSATRPRPRSQIYNIMGYHKRLVQIPTKGGDQWQHVPRMLFCPIDLGPGYKFRIYETFEFLHETWTSFYRQGLQQIGWMSGLTILYFQCEIMWHDYTVQAAKDFTQAQTSGQDEASSLLAADKTCAYVVGTSVANWGGAWENFAWHWFYHTSLGLLSIALVVDEVFNIRFGTFAPQWSRAGIGYTQVYLVATVVAGSQTFGVPALVDLRYFVLLAIFCCGLYNLFRTFVASLSLFNPEFKRSTFRIGRHPLRPWTAEEFDDPDINSNYKQEKTYTPIYEYDASRNAVIDPSTGRAKIRDWTIKDNGLFWTEICQSRIGDYAVMYDRMSLYHEAWRGELDVEARVKASNYGVRQRQIALEKAPGMRAKERGGVKRTFIHGWPIVPPRLASKQRSMARRDHQWKTPKEYYGIGNHIPHLGGWEHNGRPKRPCKKDPEQREGTFGYALLDIKRMYSFIVGGAMFALHIGLCTYDLGGGNWPAYKQAYSAAQSDWAEHKGPDSTKCQYYPGCGVAIFPTFDDGPIKGVFGNMAWNGITHTFLMGMSLAIMLVSWSNNRYYGMHMNFPITLIGPRLSSVSTGWTLGFVGFATLQQSLFFGKPDAFFFARWICYACVFGWAMHLVTPNEGMRQYIIRPGPFHEVFSVWALERMDRRNMRPEGWPDNDLQMELEHS